jgi:hypothetical protein
MSKKKVLSKKQCQEKHALQRLYERFGLTISIDEYRAIVNSIKNLGNDKKRKYDVLFLEKRSNTRTLYEIDYNGIFLYVVYDKSRGTICTFLRREWI